MKRRRIARALALISPLVFASAMIGLARDVEAVTTWFYDLSWWSYIVCADAVVFLKRGRSLLLSLPRTFVAVAVWAAFFWLCFEIANLRLDNWYYVGIPPDWFSRGPGVLLSFATVLPALYETSALLEAFGWFERARCASWTLSTRSRRVIQVIGLFSLIAPMCWPRIFYPLIWGAAVFLGEPWLASRGERGLLSSWMQGDPRPILRTLAAGAICGLLWESWNYWASAKWIYTVPFFDESKLFEMPFLGFVGFLPFGLACFTFGRMLVALGWISDWERAIPAEDRHVHPRAAMAGVAALALSIPAIVAVNTFTLRATAPRVREIPGIEPAFVERMEREGLTFARAWLRAAHGDAPWEASVPRAQLQAWIASAELMQVRGLGARGLAWLELAGVRTVEELARSDSEELFAKLATRASGPRPQPTRAEIRVWVRGARRVEA